MKILRFEITNSGAYKVKYETDNLVEITAKYDDCPIKLLKCLADTRYLYTRIMQLDDYQPDIRDRFKVVGINHRNTKGYKSYELIGLFCTPIYDTGRKMVSYTFSPATPVENKLTGEIYRDVDVSKFPALLNDDDVALIDRLIEGVKDFVLGEIESDQKELFDEADSDQ